MTNYLRDFANRFADSPALIHDGPNRRIPMEQHKTLGEIKAELCGMLVTDKTNVRLLEFLGDAFEAGQRSSVTDPDGIDQIFALKRERAEIYEISLRQAKTITELQSDLEGLDDTVMTLEAKLSGSLPWAEHAAWSAFCAAFPAYVPAPSKAFPCHGISKEYRGGNMSGVLS